MSILEIIEIYPIGTRLRLADDDPRTTHEVYGYELSGDYTNILFKDGTKLNIERLELVKEVITNADVT